MNPSANAFVFGGFNVHHKDWLTYSSWTDRPGECCHNFSISNDLTPMVNFPTRIPDCEPHSAALLDFWCWYLFYNGFPSIRKFWSYCCPSFHLLSNKLKKGCPISSHSLWLFSCWLGWSSWSFEGYSMEGEVIFKLSVSATASEFCEWFKLELMYLSLIGSIRSNLTHLHGFQQLVLLP